MPTSLPGSYLVDPERAADSRGFFARTWCEHEAQQQGLQPHMVQVSVSFNQKKGTLRGMHYQLPPSNEAKLVRCTAGAIYDVILDLRPASKTFLQHFGATLSADNRQALYLPSGFAHGFQTLVDATEVLYLMSDFYAPHLARGVRWNDPAFGIHWPDDTRLVHERDASYPDFGPQLIAELSGS